MSVEVVVSFFPGVDFAPAVVMVVGAEVSVVPILLVPSCVASFVVVLSVLPGVVSLEFLVRMLVVALAAFVGGIVIEVVSAVMRISNVIDLSLVF